MSHQEMIEPLTVDRISALPDELLIHILSFLPTKLAFTTTILSKRWTPLCHYLTGLHFDDEATQDREAYLSYRHFVDTVLLSPRLHHQQIKTFCLMSRSQHKLYDGGPWFNVDEWVEALKRHRVENLQLSTTWILRLSVNIFNSKTLVVLKLSGLMVSHRVESVDLPSLKTLHLIDTYFRKREDVQKLLFGCPILVNLYAPLIQISETGYTTGFKTLPKLLEARIRALDVPFSAVSNVEFLRIDRMERRDRNEYMNSYYKDMPVFQNLINIVLHFESFPGWDAVVEVLPYCPKLQTLGIEKYYDRQYFSKEKSAYTEEPVPRCVSLNLRKCFIVNYIDMPEDFKFAEYIMKNAKFLQVMTLHAGHVEKSVKDKFFKQISQCPRISSACKIECK